MISEQNTQKKIRRFVFKFKHEFYLKFGYFPTINTYKRKLPSENVNIDGLLEIANAILQENTPCDISLKYTNGIFTKSRSEHLINHRQIFFKMALDLGYTCSFLKNFSGFHHATVLHSKNKVNTLLEIHDHKYEMILTRMFELLYLRYGSLDDLQKLKTEILH